MDKLDKSINDILEKDFEAVDEDLIEFYYRVMTKKLRRDGTKGKEKEDKKAIDE
jgi:hypothetical protein